MRQVLFRIPGLDFPVHGFGLMVVLGFYAGLLLAAWRSKREKLDPEVMYDLALWLLVGGLIGARLFYVAEYWGEKVTSWVEIFKVWEGGIVFYGSVFGATAAFFLRRVLRPFPVLATLDALAPSVALGIGFGRIGCFLNGCCYGDLCDIPWLSVRFPQDTLPWLAERAQGLIPHDAPWTLPLHPTQLYSAFDGLILFALLSAYFPLRRRDGEVIAILMIAYPITRILIEQLRNDESAFVAGLTIAQAISLVLFLAGLALSRYLASRPPGLIAEAKCDSA
jgi:phosphatidylglycerol:prolipoprotein diacylglycerol transferase